MAAVIDAAKHRGMVRRYLVLLIIVVLSLWGAAASLTQTASTVPPASAGPATHDVDLYRAIAARVAKGENYYAVAADQHRMLHYPLKPFVTVRPPLLATLTAGIGGIARMDIALQLLALITLVAMIQRLRGLGMSRAETYAAMVFATLSLSVYALPGMALWHEAWATTLVALALAIHRPERWWPSVATALLAAIFRELAMPFLLVMGFWAVVEHRRAEAVAWAIALATAGAVLAFHAHAVAQVVNEADAISPGWAGAGGWPFVVSMLGRTSILSVFPAWIASALVPFAFLGWAGLAQPVARRATLWTGGMMTAFMIFGRPDNFYWGLMLASVLPVGLAFAPRALYALACGPR